MTVERRGDSRTGYRTVMTECPDCGADLSEGQGYVHHLQTGCPARGESA